MTQISGYELNFLIATLGIGGTLKSIEGDGRTWKTIEGRGSTWKDNVRPLTGTKTRPRQELTRQDLTRKFHRWPDQVWQDLVLVNSWFKPRLEVLSTLGHLSWSNYQDFDKTWSVLVPVCTKNGDKILKSYSILRDFQSEFTLCIPKCFLSWPKSLFWFWNISTHSYTWNMRLKW